MNTIKMFILSLFSIRLLASALLKRDLVLENGLLSPNDNTWQLRVKLGAIPTVDTCAVRYNPTTDRLEASAIIRNTGIYKGRWCAIGGVIAMYEPVGDAVRRHWGTDLGCSVKAFDWKHPYRIHQHRPPTVLSGSRFDFLPEPNKHSFSPFFVIQTHNEPKKYGSTAHGGQEASGYKWFDKTNLPGKENWAYGFHDHYFEVVNDEQLYAKIKGEYLSKNS